MDVAQFNLHVKGYLIDFVQYGFPSIALVISILSFIDSRKSKKVQDRLNDVEEKLKKYELEEKKREREEATKACVEACVYSISKGKYKLKIWNSGKATAYNVDFDVSEECKSMVFKEHVPFEFIEPNKNFEEHVIVHMRAPQKFKVTTKWQDINGMLYSKEQMVTF